MSRFRCIKWQDRDGVWHYQMLGPDRTRRARRKWQRETTAKHADDVESAQPDPELTVRLGYLAYLVDRGIIRP